MEATRSLSELASTLGTQIGELIRNELRLAAAEFIEATNNWKTAAICVAAGFLFAGAALTVLLIGVALLLNQLLPLWAAMLICGSVAAFAAYLFALSALKTITSQQPIFPRIAKQIASDSSP